jgi:hypothetical protein
MCPLTHERQPDVSFLDEGSVVVLYPESDFAIGWFDENIEAEGWQWIGGGLAVDHHMADDILNGMTAEGLLVVAR